jgi:hypothetical protein
MTDAEIEAKIWCFLPKQLMFWEICSQQVKIGWYKSLQKFWKLSQTAYQCDWG